LSSENIDILKKNNVILRAVRTYGFWEESLFCLLRTIFPEAFVSRRLQPGIPRSSVANMKNGGNYEFSVGPRLGTVSLNNRLQRAKTLEWCQVKVIFSGGLIRGDR
jgi:hypothetical protein